MEAQETICWMELLMLGLSRNEIAREVGVSRATVENWLRAFTCAPTALRPRFVELAELTIDEQEKRRNPLLKNYHQIRASRMEFALEELLDEYE